MTISSAEVDREIGEQLHTIMWRRRLTQASLADAIGLDSTALGRKLRGLRAWSSADLVRVAGVLNLEIELSKSGCAIRDSNPEPADLALRLPVFRPRLRRIPRIWPASATHLRRVV